MRRLLITLFVIMAMGSLAHAQTTVNLSVTDTPDNQTWNNGTWSVQLIPGPGNLDQTRNFTLLVAGGSLGSQSGSLSSTGTASMSLPANVNIGPVGTKWQFTVCSQQGTACSISNVTVTTSTPQAVALTPPSIRVSAAPNLPPIVVYTTTEISSASLGSQITLVGSTPTTPTLQNCTAVSGTTCTTWASAGGAAANSPLPAATSGPGPVFNVKNYGAKGDSQTTSNGACTSTASTTITCTGTAFSATTDVGKNWFCSNGTSDFYTALTTIVTVNSATSITTTLPSLFNSFTCTGVWGTLDDTAVSTASAAAIAASKGVNQLGNKGIFSGAPHLYFPSGGYLFCTALASGVVALGANASGFVIEGDGVDNSYVYSGAANGGNTCPASVLGAFVQIGSGAANVVIRNLTFDGVHQFNNNNSPAVAVNGSAQMNSVNIQRWAGNGTVALNITGTIYANNVLTVTNDGPGFQCQACSGLWESGGSSNNGNFANLVITGVFGSNIGSGFRIGKGVLIDECGSNATGCTQVINSHDVWFIGPALFGTTNGFCLNIDGNSFVHWTGGICGVFGNDTNANGPKIQAGGALEESSVRNIGSGAGKCVTVAATGLLLDNGDNSCENMYPVTSSTSTGTTAVLTVSNPSSVAPNTNCTVGDSLLVEGNSVAGYNGYFPAGITAVSATTITYLTQGSNIGAGGGGSVTCRNLQSYSGTLPKALLNNPIPNTCHLTITPITNATTFNLCNWGAGSPTNITRITASSQVVTTCATAPIITISNGTVSQTLTLTSGKQFWDSFNAQDLSTGVGTTIFKPSISLTGTDRITVKYDVAAVSACATPPTNLAVSYTISPILSN